MPAVFLRTRLICAVLATVAVAHSRAAEDSGRDSPAAFSAEVGFGGEYDSNVTVDEVDLSSSESDYALILEGSVEAEKSFAGGLDLAASYDVSQALYDEFSEVDRQTHIVGTDLTIDFAAADPGMSFYYIHSRLDNARFLDLFRLSPSLSGFLGRNWFARGAYVYSDKSIEDRPERDAATHAGETDLYYFLRGLRSYVNLGYRYRDENAEDAALDYRSHSVKLRYIQRAEILSRIARFELSWRYEDRDYRSKTAELGDERDDRRHRWSADFEIPLVGRSSMQLYWGYADYDSNYQPADYTQDVIGTRFFYRW